MKRDRMKRKRESERDMGEELGRGEENRRERGRERRGIAT